MWQCSKLETRQSKPFSSWLSTSAVKPNNSTCHRSLTDVDHGDHPYDALSQMVLEWHLQFCQSSFQNEPERAEQTEHLGRESWYHCLTHVSISSVIRFSSELTSCSTDLDMQSVDAQFLATSRDILSRQHSGVRGGLVTVCLDLHATCDTSDGFAATGITQKVSLWRIVQVPCFHLYVVSFFKELRTSDR